MDHLFEFEKIREANAQWCGEYGPICKERPEDYSYYGAM